MNENYFVLDPATGELLSTESFSESNSTDHLFLDELSGSLIFPELVDPERLKNITNVQRAKRPKQKTDHSFWQQNIRKQANANGVSYVTRKGGLKSAKFIGDFCSNCRLGCENRVLPAIRQHFFEKFYRLSSLKEKHEFILRYTRTTEVKKCKQGSRRQLSRYYFFGTGEYEHGGSETMIRVCQLTFLNTLSITDRYVRTAYQKNATGNSTDLRGYHVRNRSELDLQKRALVKQHIESFPQVESHYCRAINENKYLDSELTIPKMYELYCNSLEERQTDCSLIVTLKKYRSIFNTDYDLKFNQLNKDACDICVAFKNSTAEVKATMQVRQDEHLWLKERARERKEEHKLAAQESSLISASVFDYQKGIQLPKAEASSFYYKRKLVVHNFTIFNLKSKDAFNYVYDESLTGVGPNEVSSFLNIYIKQEIAEGKRDFRFLSDNCGGQNHNQFVFFFYVYCSFKYEIDIIHTFLVRGHIQNEGDSVHSVIERKLKKKTIYTPSQIYDSIKSARKINPYNVIEIGLSDLFDFKKIVKPNRFAKNTKKEAVKFREIREIVINHKEPGMLKYRYDYDSDYKTIRVFDVKKEKITSPKLLRVSPKGVPVLKKRDLESLCKSNLIPTESQGFFYNLKSDVRSNEPAVKKQKLLRN